MTHSKPTVLLAQSFANMLVITNEDAALRDEALADFQPKIANIAESPIGWMFTFADESVLFSQENGGLIVFPSLEVMIDGLGDYILNHHPEFVRRLMEGDAE